MKPTRTRSALAQPRPPLSGAEGGTGRETAGATAPRAKGVDAPPPPLAPDWHDPLDQAARAALTLQASGLSPVSASLAWLDWSTHLASAPATCFALTTRAWSDALAAWGAAWPGAASSTQDPPPGASADARFAAPAWSAWPYSAWRDGYLRAQSWWREATETVAGVDPHRADLVRFMVRLWLDAASPGNFAATNPVVLDAARASGGANFVAGYRHWLEDCAAQARRAAGGPPEPLAFVPGRDVAVTPGKVVWRNALCELLQYAPPTPDVAREPVFIVPSWIMKYYVLDLQPHNSLVRFLVDQGFTVFMLSWHNPSPAERDWHLDDYLNAVFEALAAARARCGDAPAHAVGYCLGGTLLAIAAAALGREPQAVNGSAPMQADALRTVSLLAAQTDFRAPGELRFFIGESELAALDALMARQGCLEGEQMAATFQLLNSRDLVWSRAVNEYLLGQRSKPNDLMSWNADTTRMPYRMHSEYLRRLYLHNDLAQGRYRVNGHAVSLADIAQPMFMVGTERDHVSPWRSVYQLLHMTRNPATFVLTSGGHNAGIVSEPGHPRRHYRCGNREAGAPWQPPQSFFDETPPVEGSWWPRFAQWLHAQSSEKISARGLEEGLVNAPGVYIFER
ncbi:PHA/PHB synthase family protein [Paraburkholderia tropica]|uniref:Polyhydroxyalkanoate synthase n=1 Tax=Paraburkholderia tropica TaxID=92647 RepID=A0ABX5MLG6_9BURK|nr:alpha/beta fold hydrolase [Paraburkholderia tropica]MDE1138741.1 alpha/beta fold hydrolase [Paraburkholderia tropica]PXX14251.1 polyhydroxyalkanoate synthase [Paraburkholderia tropica]PZW79087.1 polyhydroxyalkanoate synthase [Paraburkholderia tropica]